MWDFDSHLDYSQHNATQMPQAYPFVKIKNSILFKLQNQTL